MSADTAPAAMPSEREISGIIIDGMDDLRVDIHFDIDNKEQVADWAAAKIAALFAPILAEKERRDALDREQAETARFLQQHLNNPQPPSEALKNLLAGIDSPFNACCYRDECREFEARALAAEAAIAKAENGGIGAAIGRAAVLHKIDLTGNQIKLLCDSIVGAIRTQIAAPRAAKEAV